MAVREEVAKALGLKKEDVTCHVTLLGGGFGRKSKPDYCVEAAVLSKQTGKPVKVIWSREDDIKFDYFHSVAAMYIKAAVDDKGMPKAWLQRTVFPPIASTFDKTAVYGDEVSLGWDVTPFALSNFRSENGPAIAHVRIGWLRSVANIYHAFAVQTFANELAYSANRDPYDYLLDLIGPGHTIDVKDPDEPEIAKKYPYDTARLRHVGELAAKKQTGARKNLEMDGAWASRFIAAFSPTLRPWWKSKSTIRARSGFRMSTRLWMRESSPIQTWCSRSFRVQPYLVPASRATERSQPPTAQSTSRTSTTFRSQE